MLGMSVVACHLSYYISHCVARLFEHLLVALPFLIRLKSQEGGGKRYTFLAWLLRVETLHLYLDMQQFFFSLCKGNSAKCTRQIM